MSNGVFTLAVSGTSTGTGPWTRKFQGQGPEQGHGLCTHLSGPETVSGGVF